MELNVFTARPSYRDGPSGPREGVMRMLRHRQGAFRRISDAAFDFGAGPYRGPNPEQEDREGLICGLSHTPVQFELIVEDHAQR
jgi:hypothetical protein